MRRVWHLLGVGAVGLVLLGLATVYDGWLPSSDDDPGSAPFVRTIGVGDQAALRLVDLEIDSVAGAVSVDNAGTELLSPGLWVVVRYTVTPQDESSALFFAEARDADGRVWSLGDGRNENSCPAGPPGVPVGCVAMVEVPPDALSTLVLRLAPRDELRYDAVADVDLGLTAEDAAAFAEVRGLEIPSSTVGGL